MAELGFKSTEAWSRDQPLNPYAMTLLEDTLSVLLLKKLRAGAHSLYLWANELCEGLPCGQRRLRAGGIRVLPGNDTACENRKKLRYSQDKKSPN